MSTDSGLGHLRVRRLLRNTVMTAVIVFSSILTCWLVGTAALSLAGNRNAPWILGRAAGITSYILLIALVTLGLLLSHPRRSRIVRPSATTRIRTHVALAVFTLVFTVLHVVVLATDSYAGVGIFGSLVPMGSTYRPVPVTLGVIGLYAGLLAGLTASLAGRFIGRIWWPIHKVSAISLVLVWGHGFLAGSDSPVMQSFYIATAALVVGVGISRYVAKTPSDLVDDLNSAMGPLGEHRAADGYLAGHGGPRR